MSRADWRILWPITLIAPFLSPLGLLGAFYGLFFFGLALVSGRFDFLVLSIGKLALLAMLMAGLPAFLSGYGVITKFRRTFESGEEPRFREMLASGALTGLFTSALIASIAIGFLMSDARIGYLVGNTVAFAIGSGMFTGGAAAWMARRGLRAEMQARRLYRA